VTNAADVACFGELLWDFFEGEGATYHRHLGGASANLAVGLSRLGVASAAIGGVGDDRLGGALKDELAEAGVDVGHVVKVKGTRTGITFVSRDAGGEPSFVPYRSGTADSGLGEAHVTAAMAKTRFVVLGSTALLGAARPAAEKLLAAAEKAKTPVVVDLNVRPHLWPDAESLREACKALASRATLVKASEKDMSSVAGKRGVSWLDENAKQATWILTRGENGAACVGPHGQATAPTKRVRCIDATGAGDAFLAGVLAVLVRAGAKPSSADWKDGKLWSRAMETGHQIAAKVVAHVGATTGTEHVADIRARIDAAKKK
jgi:sugar/nucleoside kinase (ribokinase family)